MVQTRIPQFYKGENHQVFSEDFLIFQKQGIAITIRKTIILRIVKVEKCVLMIFLDFLQNSDKIMLDTLT